MFCLNVQSFTAHIEEISELIGQTGIEVFLATESRVTSDIEDHEISIHGYNIVRCDSESRFTGGVLCIIREDLSFHIVTVVQIPKLFWLIAVRIEGCIIVCLYRSPSSSIPEFLERVCEIMEDIITLNCINLYIVGDFNIDVNKSKPTFYSIKLLNMMKSFGLAQKVNDFTRIVGDHKTIIDLLFTNDEKSEVQVIRQPKVTDHDIVSCTKAHEGKEKAKNKNSNRDAENIRIRNIKNIDKDQLERHLMGKTWIQDGSVNVLLQSFNNNLVEVLDTVAPIQTLKNSPVKNKWFDQEIKHLIKKRDTLYNRARLQNCEENWENYRASRNSVTALIRKKKQKYYESIIDQNRGDSKKMWKGIKEVMGKNKKSQINEVYFNGEKITEKQDIAEHFNRFFIQSIENIINDTNGYDITLEIEKIEVNKELKAFSLISERETVNIINNLNKESSVDEITRTVLKLGSSVISRELKKIINKSITTCEVPEAWKVSIVSPIQKVTNTKKCEEFRPINMVPLCEKVLELFIKQQLLTHVNINKILIENQSGFREKHSCETAIQLVVSKWKEALDANKIILTVFIDFKRAFETIDRTMLIKKLEKYGVVDKAKKWFCSYLSNRCQKVKIGNSLSETEGVVYGVPQGTVLGCLLFIIYVNDIAECIDEDIMINLFADDTAVSVIGESIELVQKKMQDALNKLEKWMVHNKLFVNIKKTKGMLFATKYNVINPELKMFNENIEFVNECKYLGLIIDKDLKFSKHAVYMAEKVGKRINFFGRICKNLSYMSRIQVYKTLIAPLFEYCPTILLYINECDKQKLQVQQNRAMRAILQVNRYVSIGSMLECLCFMSINQRLVYNNLLFIYKIVKRLLPEYMVSRITFVNDVHLYNTRTSRNIYIPTAKKALTQKSLFYRGLTMYNRLPLVLRETERLSEFKRNLNIFVKQNYN